MAELGNLASKVQGIFQKMRQPVDTAVTWLIRKAKDLVLKLGRKLGLVQDDNSQTNQQQGTIREGSSEASRRVSRDIASVELRSLTVMPTLS